MTRCWLEEFVDLDGVTLEAIADALNRIGLEVAGMKRYQMPDRVVVGHVVACEKHPDADKLSVTRVDVGNEILQIVCGAANIAAGQRVAVALIGAILPGGLEIKRAKLRGVDSFGMICSAKELGLPDIGAGIMILDASIGDVALGTPLSAIPLFNDETIEVELTANRGDCLSILGMARELAAALDRPMVERSSFEDDEHSVGIGRILHIQSAADVTSSLIYRAIEGVPATLPLKHTLRLALVNESWRTPLEGFLIYAIHATGVILRAYRRSWFKSQDNDEKTVITIELHNGVDEVCRKVGSERSIASIIGISQLADTYPTKEDDVIILEASYTNPIALAMAQFEHRLESDALYYRSSRGSEVAIESGMDYLISDLRKNGIKLFAGAIKHLNAPMPRLLKITMSRLEQIVGMPLEKNSIVSILKKLSFDVTLSHSDDELFIGIPLFRHDIVNEHDIAEEIVRMYGIDHIPAAHLQCVVKKRTSPTWQRWQRERRLRERAVATGFSEAIHFIFTDKAMQQRYGFECVDEKLDIANPITAELDTLRTTLCLQLVDSVVRNVKNGYRRIALFEQGVIYDASREERRVVGFIWSGALEEAKLSNHGKPAQITFGDFIQKLAAIIGHVEIEEQRPLQPSFFHPYQYGLLRQEDEAIGFVGRLHPAVERDQDLPATYLAQLFADKLYMRTHYAQAISPYQKVKRDLTLITNPEISYARLRCAIDDVAPAELKSFYPIDRYQPDGGEVALTLRFEFQSDKKTFEESEITQMMQRVVEAAASVGAQIKS